MSQYGFSESRAVGGWNRRTEDWLFLETSTPSETMAGQEGRVPCSPSTHSLAHDGFSFFPFSKLVLVFENCIQRNGFHCGIFVDTLLCFPHLSPSSAALPDPWCDGPIVISCHIGSITFFPPHPQPFFMISFLPFPLSPLNFMPYTQNSLCIYTYIHN